jgi:hypothetical protein
MSKFKGFSKVKVAKPQKSHFDLSHQVKLSTRMGYLTPVMITECLPSDSFNGNVEALVRLAPLQSPIFDMITVYVHSFFVPFRLIWEDSEEFFSGGRLGVGVDPVDAPIPPYVDLGKYIDAGYDSKGTTGDYLGVPTFSDLPGFGTASDYDGIHMDIAPILAYNLVWYEYYRDRNYVADDWVDYPVPSGELDIDAGTNTRYVGLYQRCWTHDYFTSALPFTQRGEEVLMPLAGSGSVSYLASTPIVNTTTGLNAPDLAGLDTNALGFLSDTGSAQQYRVENIDEVMLDSSSVSINDFRAAYAIQVWLERNAVGGGRYSETIPAHFGIPAQDSRLQRPEYIGGGRIPVKISEVVATAFSSDGEATVPLGNMGGHGVTYGNTNNFRYFCPEHGFIISILSIMNPPSYFQGLPRMFHRPTFLDYAWPTFAKLGEQQVDTAELFASATNLTEDSEGNRPLFGYQSRYADWKQIQSRNAGEFKDTLKFWTLVREFDSSPVLNNTFVSYDDSVQDRIFVVGEQQNFWLLVNNNLHVRRPLPYYGTPNNLGFQ